jgi:hypothetical protein
LQPSNSVITVPAKGSKPGGIQMIRSRYLAGAALAVTLLACAPAFAAGEWSERVQIIYDAKTNSVTRAKVRVWDTEPEKHLDFLWEPAAGATLRDDGAISGKGKLTWRVRGSASYDPKAIYSVYDGEVRDGRPNGKGHLEVRSGEMLDGVFTNGLLEGHGKMRSADGSQYEGDFKDGVPSGFGRLALKTGEIYVGAFVAGVRHGKGKTTLPGGTSYQSTWSMGREFGGKRNMVADATLGGLIKAQSGGGDAGKVEIGVTIDDRMNQQSDMRYVQNLNDENIEIFPEMDQQNAAWRGDGEVTTDGYYISGIDWTSVPAFVQVDLNTNDGSRVKLDKLELQVKDSIAYKKPMLTLFQHIGCTGTRPDFSILNNGWGNPKNVVVNVQFAGEAPTPDDSGEGEESDAAADATKAQTAQRAVSDKIYPIKVPDFAEGTEVSIESALTEAGVDLAKLKDQRFKCQSRDSLNICKNQVFNSLNFGEVRDYVYGDQTLFTTATGKIDYDWEDDFGNSYHQSEPFSVDISLAWIEIPEEAAECGDGFGGAPDAPRYQDVNFPLNQSNYTIDMPVRGNKSLKEYTARLKLHADQTSYHEFTVSAKFGDGSTRQSKPVNYYFFKPKPSPYTAPEPTGCYLPPEAGGC